MVHPYLTFCSKMCSVCFYLPDIFYFSILSFLHNKDREQPGLGFNNEKLFKQNERGSLNCTKLLKISSDDDDEQ